ncbi:MAG TPA: hypothetical protein VJZ91_02520 [Blastocatellia bacterium]|nr:hypothetical protein [Blastocatellia bacterium]
MNRPRLKIASGLRIAVLFALAAPAFAQAGPTAADSAAPSSRPHFVKAFVIDERLSALRQEADLHAPVLKRLRVGRAVYVMSKSAAGFYRVAVTRRTRGWISQGAVALPGRAGEDGRMMQVIEATGDGPDRIALCRLLLEHFGRSRHAPRALLLIGEEAERAAASLSQHARRRLKSLDAEKDGASVEAFYLNDPGLDRYSRLGIAFRFDAPQTVYAYDGRAYRDLLRRYPQSAEAEAARRRLRALEPRLASEK